MADTAYRSSLGPRRTIETLAQGLRAAGTDVAIIQADVGDPERLRAALSPLFVAPGAPGVVIYNAALAASDDLLTVSPEQLAAAYGVDVIGGVLTAQLAAPAGTARRVAARCCSPAVDSPTRSRLRSRRSRSASSRCGPPRPCSRVSCATTTSTRGA